MSGPPPNGLPSQEQAQAAFIQPGGMSWSSRATRRATNYHPADEKREPPLGATATRDARQALQKMPVVLYASPGYLVRVSANGHCGVRYAEGEEVDMS